MLKGRGATIFQTSRSRSRIVRRSTAAAPRSSCATSPSGGPTRTPATGTRPTSTTTRSRWAAPTHVHLGNLRIRNVGGDALYLAAGRSNGRVRWAAAVRLHHSVIDGTGRSGVSIADGAKAVSVDHNAFRRVAYYTFNIEPNGMVWNGVAAGRATSTSSGTASAHSPTGRAATASPMATRSSSPGRPAAGPPTTSSSSGTGSPGKPLPRRRLQQRRPAPEHPGRGQSQRQARRRARDVLRRRQDARRHRATASR